MLLLNENPQIECNEHTKTYMYMNARYVMYNDFIQLFQLSNLTIHDCSNTFFERSFNFAEPTEWNRLDKRIRRISNLNTFKSEIKTILFLNYFDV